MVYYNGVSPVEFKKKKKNRAKEWTPSESQKVQMKSCGQCLDNQFSSRQPSNAGSFLNAVLNVYVWFLVLIWVRKKGAGLG